MDYELANELKMAGLSQKWREGMSFFNKSRQLIEPVRKKNSVVWDAIEGAKVPTLEELVEACGDSFGGLVRRTNWIAMNKDGVIYRGGGTPIEAAARLWLALQKVNTPRGSD
jgi:hypothetical protein